MGSTNEPQHVQKMRMQGVVEYLQSRSSKLSTMFRNVDEDKSGEIDKDEFNQLLRNVDPRILPADMEALFEMVDVSGDGQIQFDEFVDQLMNAEIHALGVATPSTSFPDPNHRP